MLEGNPLLPVGNTGLEILGKGTGEMSEGMAFGEVKTTDGGSGCELCVCGYYKLKR